MYVGTCLSLTPAERVCQRLQAMPVMQQAQRISVFLSMPTAEIDTWSLCRWVLSQGKDLYIPRFSTIADGAHATTKHQFTEMHMLRVMSVDELDHGLTPNKWGIAEPSWTLDNGAPRENALEPTSRGLDVIVMPGLAFDRQGGRLGHGKGYYDKYLLDARARTPGGRTAAIAIALEEQVLDEPVPRDAHDMPYDALITAEALYSVSTL